jgi:hypothetical protein
LWPPPAGPPKNICGDGDRTEHVSDVVRDPRRKSFKVAIRLLDALK